MRTDPQPARPAAPRRSRRLLFGGLAASLALPLLMVIELLARLLLPAPAGDPFLGMSGSASIFSEVDVDGVRCYRITHPSAYAHNNTTFPVAKAPGVLRVFCLGGSASAGWPHPGDQTYPRYLQHGLQQAFPERRVEVINAGAHAYASYRVRGIFEDVLRFAPDLIVLYVGNNEFVERRTYLAGGWLGRALRGLERWSRLAQWIGQAARSRNSGSQLSGADRTDAAWHTWSHTEQVAAELRTDPAQFAEVLAHYEYTVEAMVAEAGARGVALAVLTVPVNLRDWRPHVSASGLAGRAAERFEAGLRAARRTLLQGDARAAAQAFEALLAEAPGHAAAWFHSARALEALGRHGEAVAAYIRAKDEDRNPFRALSLGNEAVRRIASRHPQVVLVEAERALLAATAPRAPGFDLFLDYVHPTRAGNEAIARVVFEAVLARGVLPGTPATRAFQVDPANAYDETRDTGVQITLLSLFSIMHQYEAFLEKLDHVELLLRGGAPLPDAAAQLLSDCRAAFQAYLEEERKEILGEPFAPDYRERHREFYRAFFGRISTLKH